MYQKLHILAISLLMLMYTSMVSYGQKRDTVKLYFRFDSFLIDSTYQDNAENLRRMQEIFSTTHNIGFINVDISTSPEGAHKHNLELSDNRLEGIKNYLVSLSGNKLTPERVSITSITENWEGLKEQVDMFYFRHDRDRILKLLANPNLSGARKWSIIQSLNEGYSWKVIQKNYLPVLRYAYFDIATWRAVQYPEVFTNEFFYATPLTSATIIPRPEVNPEEDPEILKLRAALRANVWRPVENPSVFNKIPTTALPLTSTTIIPRPKVERVEMTEMVPQEGFCANLRTNLLMDLAMIPNVGLELHLGKRWSMGASWAYSWWDKDANNFYWRVYGGELNFRKYFGKKIKDVNLSGHHIGVYGHAFTYDFEVSPKGQLSKLNFGVGLDYGYSVPLTRRLNLDFSVGFGYLTGEYKLYEFDTDCYVWQETRQRHWIGPTKAEIALVWNFGKERGGRR